jgi:hypothetical protein
MAGAIAPIMARVGKIGFAQIASAVTAADLTSAALIFTADATNGSILYEVRVKYLPGTSTTSTPIRIFLNNNGTLSTTTNNSLITEINVPAITTTQTAGTTDFFIPMPKGGLILPASYRVYATAPSWTTGTFMVTAFGGDF